MFTRSPSPFFCRLLRLTAFDRRQRSSVCHQDKRRPTLVVRLVKYAYGLMERIFLTYISLYIPTYESNGYLWVNLAIEGDSYLASDDGAKIFYAFIPNSTLIYCPQPSSGGQAHCHTSITTADRDPIYIEREKDTSNTDTTSTARGECLRIPTQACMTSVYEHCMDQVVSISVSRCMCWLDKTVYHLGAYFFLPIRNV